MSKSKPTITHVIFDLDGLLLGKRDQPWVLETTYKTNAHANTDRQYIYTSHVHRQSYQKCQTPLILIWFCDTSCANFSSLPLIL